MRLFTWGNNARGNLGHDSQQHRKVTWPRPVEIDHEVGLVVDVQCGLVKRFTKSDLEVSVEAYLSSGAGQHY